nr:MULTISPECIES: carboxypeptidase-like regulatory domain-containing protein [Myxococcaceae]
MRSACVLITLLVASAVQAQSGALLGSVRDRRTDAALPRVRVTVRASTLPAPLEVHTDAEGNYRLASLRPGSYLVTLEREGFATATRAELHVRDGRVLRVNVALEPLGEERAQEHDLPHPGRLCGGERRLAPSPPARGFESLVELAPPSVSEAYALSIGPAASEQGWVLEGVVEPPASDGFRPSTRSEPLHLRTVPVREDAGW